MRTPESEEEVLERIAFEPSTSMHVITHAMGTHQSSACRVLQEQNLHAFHLQKVQGPGLGNFTPGVQFVQ
jgi:hypothetical protein